MAWKKVSAAPDWRRVGSAVDWKRRALTGAARSIGLELLRLTREDGELMRVQIQGMSGYLANVTPEGKLSVDAPIYPWDIHGGYGKGDGWAPGIIADPYWASMTDDGKYLCIASTTGSSGRIDIFNAETMSLIRTLSTGPNSLALACDIRLGTRTLLYRNTVPQFVEHDLDTGQETVLFTADSADSVALYCPGNHNLLMIGQASAKLAKLVDRAGTEQASVTLPARMRTGSIFWDVYDNTIIASMNDGFALYKSATGAFIGVLSGTNIPGNVYARQNMLTLGFEQRPVIVVDAIVPIPYYELPSPANAATIRLDRQKRQWEYVMTYGYGVYRVPESLAQMSASQTWASVYQIGRTVGADGGLAYFVPVVPKGHKGSVGIWSDGPVTVELQIPEFVGYPGYAQLFVSANSGTGAPKGHTIPSYKYVDVTEAFFTIPDGMYVGIVKITNNGTAAVTVRYLFQSH